MDVKLATLIKSLNIMDVIFSGFTVTNKNITDIKKLNAGYHRFRLGFLNVQVRVIHGLGNLEVKKIM